MRTQLLLFAAAAITILILAALLAFRMAPKNSASNDTWYNGVAWVPSKPLPAPDFRLRDQAGEQVSLGALRGRTTLITFASAVCRQQCPLIARTLAMTERQLGTASKQTVLLNISVDPEADTSRAIKQFAHEAGWTKYQWHYLSASRRRLKPIWRAYSIFVPNPPPIYKPGLQVIHSAVVAVIDKQGHLRSELEYPFSPSDLTAMLRHIQEA